MSSKLSPRLPVLRSVLCVCALAWGGAAVAQESEWSAPGWLMSPEQIASRDSSRIVDEGRSQIRSSAPNSQAVDKYIELFLSDIVVSKNRTNTINTFLGFLATTASSAGRNKVNEELLARVPAFLTHPDPNVRFNAVAVLAQLISRPGEIGKPGAPYLGARKLFIDIVTNEQQFRDTRIVAVRGLKRMLADGGSDLSSNDRSDIVDALVAGLRQTPPSEEPGKMWFRRTLIQTLGVSDRPDNVTREPVVLTSLLGVLIDPQENWMNRAYASKALSQVPLPGQTNLPLLVNETLKLLADMGEAFAAEGAAKVSPEAIALVYLSFKPENEDMAARNWGYLNQIRRAGLSAHSDYVNSAFRAAHPVLKAVLPSGQKPSAGQLAELRKWVADNRPEDRRITPEAQPIP